MPKVHSRSQKRSSLKTILGVLVFFLLAAGLTIGSFLSQRTQIVESDASVKGGIAQIQFEPTSQLVEANKTTAVPVTLNTNNALIDGVQISIQIKGVKTKDVKFVPSQSPLSVSQNILRSGADQNGVDVVFLSPSNQPLSIPGRVTLGEIVFTPLTTGRIELAFDASFSKVTTHVVNTTTPIPSPTALPTPDATQMIPVSDTQATTPLQTVVRDILQTPNSVYISVVTGDPQRPSPSPLQGCNSDANCKNGYICYQPPMPACPVGTACTAVMPTRYCRPAASPVPSPQTKCNTNADCRPNHRCANGSCISVVITSPKPSPSVPPSPVSYLVGDLNGDKVVNILDLSILTKSLLQKGNLTADLNRDGIVDLVDYSTMLTYIR